MLQGHDIVCTGLMTWQNDYNKPTMELLAEAARHNRVLFVNYAYTLKDVWLHARGKRTIPLAQVMGRADRLVQHKLVNGSTINVLTPPAVLPINALPAGPIYDALLHLNTRRILTSTRQAINRLGFTSPIVVNALYPTIGIGLAGQLGEKALVYHCYDAIEAERWSGSHGQTAEELFLRRVDAVITTSQGLYDTKSQIQPHCYLIENGADVNLFAQANVVRTHREPKTIGYMGAIDNRLDMDLLERCFRRFAHCRFLMVGRVPDPTLAQRLSQFDNVTLAGPQPPAQLPQWVAQMDVGLIPFQRNVQTRAIYPMKINEYLAAGLPVVSTDFADLRAFGSVVAVSHGADAFMVAIESALGETDPLLPQQRVALARTNSWENRGRQFTEVLEQVLQQKSVSFPNTVVPDYTV